MEAISFNDFKKIVLKRANLEEWCDKIFFGDAVIGSFVRIQYKPSILVV